MKKWKCSPKVKKKILDVIRYNYDQLKKETDSYYLAWYYGHAVGNLQAAYCMDCMTWGLFEKYHDVIYTMYKNKKKELTGRV